MTKTRRISLAHIDTADCLRRNREQFAAEKAAAQAVNDAAAGNFVVGQTVAMKNNRHNTGHIVSVDGGKVSVNMNGKIRTFVAAMVVAA